MSNESELAWAAGVFESEGTVADSDFARECEGNGWRVTEYVKVERED